LQARSPVANRIVHVQADSSERRSLWTEVNAPRDSMAACMDAPRSIFVLALLLMVPFGVSGQDSPPEKKSTTLEKVIALGLPHAARVVPTYYSPGFEARALKYQRTLVACQQWYDEQVGKHVDFALAVLNKADWEKVSDGYFVYPLPYSLSLGDPIVVLPGRFEDFPNSAGFTDDVELLVENIAYHELGHIYAHFIDMEAEDNFLAETYANVFMVSFVRARRPDMLFFLQGPPVKLPPQRYTSMEDLQYLASDVGMANYGWFQFQTYRMSDVLLQDKPLPILLSELKKAFRDPTLRPFPYVAAQMEAIHPGIGEEMGSVWKPTTLPGVQPTRCKEAAVSSKESVLVVQNLSSNTVKLTTAKQPEQSVAPNSWTTVNAHAGDLVHVSGGSCFVFGDEPAIARIR
jgi:hypothetical protein